MSSRTSDTHPLRIAEIELDSCKIGLSLCPGKIQFGAMTGNWERDLRKDLMKIKESGYDVVVSLIEAEEFEELQVEGLRDGLVEELGMSWHWAPIADFSTPEQSVNTKLKEVLFFLEEGKSVFVHCKGGLGRAGLVSAWLLTHFGRTSYEAIREVREARSPSAIETKAQENWIHQNSGIRFDQISKGEQ